MSREHFIFAMLQDSPTSKGLSAHEARAEWIFAAPAGCGVSKAIWFSGMPGLRAGESCSPVWLEDMEI